MIIKKFNEMINQDALEEFEDENGYPLGRDFIFALGEYDEPDPEYANFCLVIQPKSVWDNEQRMWDGQVTDNILNLPSKFEEVQESSFMYQCGTGPVGNFGVQSATPADKQNAPVNCINEMVQLGLKFSPGFQAFMDQHGSPFLINGVTLLNYMSQNYPNSIV